MPTQTNQFSTSKMKEVVKSETNRRVSGEAADSLGVQAAELAYSRSEDSLHSMRLNGRKTLRAVDIENSREEEPTGYDMDLPSAPIDRIMRKAGAERVSAEAVEELKKEVIQFLKENSVEMDQMADYAGRKTIKLEDLQVAVGDE